MTEATWHTRYHHIRDREIDIPPKVTQPVKVRVSIHTVHLDEKWTHCIPKWTSLMTHGISRRSNQSILKEISPEYSSEGLILKLKLQYFGHLMRRADFSEKTLMLGKIEGGGEGNDRGLNGWLASPTQWTRVWASSGRWWWTGRPGVLQSMGSQRVRHDWVTKLNWMTHETVRNQLAGIYPFMIGKDFCKHKVIEETTGEKTDNIKIKHNEKNLKSVIPNLRQIRQTENYLKHAW